MENKLTSIPITKYKDINTISLSWENILSKYEHLELEFMLFVKEKGGWKYVYRGKKSQYDVRNLEASTCYVFKLEILNWNDKIDSIEFKATTDFEPYYNLHISRAINQGKPSLLRKVVSQRPILLELENRENKTPLAYVAATGDLAMATLLIALGANVNNPTMLNQRTPLMVALFHGHLPIATLLLDKGSDISLRDCNGLTAMHYAIDSGKLENVEFALEHGFDINLTDNSGWSALLRAVVMECSEEIIKYLIMNKADMSIKDKNGFDFYKHCEISGFNIDIDESNATYNLQEVIKELNPPCCWKLDLVWVTLA